jgi:hypothetical protein
MSQSESFTFYTYSLAIHDRDRWAYTGIPDIFFHSETEARQALHELRRDVIGSAEETWWPMQLEKIETLPITRESIFALLNDGVGAFVQSYEVIDIIR